MKQSSFFENFYSLWTSHKSRLLEITAFIIQCLLVFSALNVEFPERELFSFLLEKLFCYVRHVPLSESHAGTFISVNATIFMIYATLWSLLSNLSSRSFAGIYYNDFFLNIRPVIFRQKRVLLVSLAMLGISCACYPYKLYAMIEALLFCEMICIAFSSLFIYTLFAGSSTDINEEIRKYSLQGQLPI